MRSSPPPIAMNGMYRRQRHIYDATRKWYLDRARPVDRRCFGRVATTRSSKSGAAPARKPGSGRPASIRARASSGSICVDGKCSHPRFRAIDQSGLSSRVRVAHADATAFLISVALFQRPRFERITIVLLYFDDSGRGATCWRPRSRCSRRAGNCISFDFGRQERLPSSCRAALRAWLKLFGGLAARRIGDGSRHVVRPGGREPDRRAALS